MMADVPESLEETDLRSDMMRIMVPVNCCFYKPVQLCDFNSKELYQRHRKNDYINVASAYTSRDPSFQFPEMAYNAFSRFIELLASVTLYHFSNTSRSHYYWCLDIRGLEFKFVDGCDFKEFESYSFPPERFTGKRERGLYLSSPHFLRYQVCHGHVQIRLLNLTEPVVYELNLAKTYRVLSLRIDKEFRLTKLCANLFHPGIEHVYIHVTSFCHPVYQRTSERMSIRNFETCLLDHCQNVRTIDVVFATTVQKSAPVERLRHVLLRNRPHVRKIKQMIENWARTTSRLEIFFLTYRNRLFQLHGLTLKRLVKQNDKWYFDENCDIHTANMHRQYPPHSEFRDEYNKVPKMIKDSHYTDVFKYLNVKPSAAERGSGQSHDSDSCSSKRLIPANDDGPSAKKPNF